MKNEEVIVNNFKADGSIGGCCVCSSWRSREQTDRHDQLGGGES